MMNTATLNQEDLTRILEEWARKNLAGFGDARDVNVLWMYDPPANPRPPDACTGVYCKIEVKIPPSPRKVEI